MLIRDLIILAGITDAEIDSLHKDLEDEESQKVETVTMLVDKEVYTER